VPHDQKLISPGTDTYKPEVWVSRVSCICSQLRSFRFAEIQKCACTQYVRAKKMCVWGGLEQTHKTLETHIPPKRKPDQGRASF
jgi:hypothetical protein